MLNFPLELFIFVKCSTGLDSCHIKSLMDSFTSVLVTSQNINHVLTQPLSTAVPGSLCSQVTVLSSWL